MGLFDDEEGLDIGDPHDDHTLEIDPVPDLGPARAAGRPGRGRDPKGGDDDSVGAGTIFASALAFTLVVVIGVFWDDLGGLSRQMSGIAAEAPSVRYSGYQLAQSTDGRTHMVNRPAHAAETYRAERTGATPPEPLGLEPKNTLDFSRILTPREKETTPAMQSIARTCEQKTTRVEHVTLHKAHSVWVEATRYLDCAMSRQVERLCDARERERLVEQLDDYRHLRQHIFAIERIRDRGEAAMEGGGPLGVVSAKDVEARAAPFIDAMGPAPSGPDPTNPKIGAQLDPRIADGIGRLTRAGYLTIGDFRSWLRVPAEYVPYIEPPQRAGVCG